MPKALSITLVVLAPVLAIIAITPEAYRVFGAGAVWITAIILVLAGSYYLWVKPRNRRRRLLVIPVLIAVFVIPSVLSALVFPPQPCALHVAARKLIELEAELRQGDPWSGVSTLAGYAREYETLIGKSDLELWVDWGPYYAVRPPMAQIDFPQLARFYGESRDLWKDYLSLRSEYQLDAYISSALSRKFETQYPELDASLFLWGKKSTLESEEAVKIVIAMTDYYDISQEMMPAIQGVAGRELWEMWEMSPRVGTLRTLEDSLATRVNAYGWKERFGY